MLMASLINSLAPNRVRGIRHPQMNTKKIARGKSAQKKAAQKKTAKKKIIKKAVRKAASSASKNPRGQTAAVALKKPIRQRASFRLNEYIVYPAHGVGQIIEIKEQMIAEQAAEFFIIDFKQERLVLKVPVLRAASGGMRKLADEKLMRKGIAVLKEPARIKRTMWSRRAQEYEAKINSGDFILLCEVVRDLYRSESQREQSYSERQLYEAAFARLQREVALARKTGDEAATETLLSVLIAARREDDEIKSSLATPPS